LIRIQPEENLFSTEQSLSKTAGRGNSTDCFSHGLSLILLEVLVSICP